MRYNILFVSMAFTIYQTQTQTKEVIETHWSVIVVITDILTNIEKRGKTISMKQIYVSDSYV